MKSASTSTTGPLRVPAFRRYFLGTAISLTGGSMASVALAFAVLEATTGLVDLGLVLTSQSLPAIGFVLVGGTVADRFRRGTILWICNVGAAVTQAGVAVILLTGGYHLAPVMALSFVNGALVSFSGPATRGIIPQLVAAEQLRRANSLLAMWKNGTRMAGPAVAGLLTATAGGGWAIAFDAVTFAVAAGFLIGLKVPRSPGGGSRRFLGQLREGWSYFRSLTWVWSCVLSLSVINLLLVGVWNVLGPIIAEATFGAAWWGVALGARAAGVLIGSAVLYRLRVRRLLLAVQLGIAVGALPLVTLGLSPRPYPVIAAALLAGIGSGIAGPAWDTAIQERVPGHVLSRVSSYDELGSFLGVPLGQVGAAPVALALGFGVVATGGGLLWFVAALAPLLVPTVRDLGRTEVSHDEPPGADARAAEVGA